MTNIAKDIKVNEKITSREVRVIDFEGSQLGIFPLAEALKIASEKSYDLVEVSPNSSPPACRLMDYGRHKYAKSKKSHQSKKKHVQKVIHIKEIKLRPKTDEHDIQFKLRHIEKFLSHGDKAKITLTFRGREITHPELGRKVMDRIVEEVKEFGVVESPPKLEGRNMTMLIAPKS